MITTLSYLKKSIFDKIWDIMGFKNKILGPDIVIC